MNTIYCNKWREITNYSYYYISYSIVFIWIFDTPIITEETPFMTSTVLDQKINTMN